MDYLELNVEFLFENDISSWDSIASTIRGVWGRVLKRLYCFQKQIECPACSMSNCSYYTIFEKKYGDAGQYHPYIILPILKSDNTALVTFKFFGWVVAHYDKLLFSILEMEKSGFNIDGNRTTPVISIINDGLGNRVYTKGNSKLKRPKITKIEFEPELVNRVILEFETPLRQKSADRLMQDFKWEPFIKSLMNRIRFINNYFNNNELTLPSFIPIDDVSTHELNFDWQEQVRKSFRQQQVMSIGGLVGTVSLENISPECYGILKLGSYLHAGKQTTFGNGFYKLQTTSEQEVL